MYEEKGYTNGIRFAGGDSTDGWMSDANELMEVSPRWNGGFYVPATARAKDELTICAPSGPRLPMFAEPKIYPNLPEFRNLPESTRNHRNTRCATGIKFTLLRPRLQKSDRARAG